LEGVCSRFQVLLGFLSCLNTLPLASTGHQDELVALICTPDAFYQVYLLLLIG